jgi:hypothetical protein
MTAPKVFISYSHDSPDHKNAILTLSDRLRREGIDCAIDQYEQSPEEGWPRWCEKQVEQANFVLVACTETYLRRFRGGEAPGKGLGGTWEGHIITQELYNAQGKNTKQRAREDDGSFALSHAAARRPASVPGHPSARAFATPDLLRR